MVLKHSKQRDSIKEFLMGRKDHPTAAVVYDNVRRSFPNISLGTVYRNLTLLADIGEISRIHVGDGVDHFDEDNSPHNHIICSECGSVRDLDMQVIELDEIASRNFDGQIECHTVYFHGRCRDCCQRFHSVST